MRLYAILGDVGSEYETIAPTKISLTPFEGACDFIDLEENKTYETISYEVMDEASPWRPYNGVISTGDYCKHKDSGELIGPIMGYTYSGRGCTIHLENDFEMLLNDNHVIGYMYQKYENGEPIGEPYFVEG